MHVSIIGSGYVGTTIAACLADLGHEVVNVEIDERIVETINAGEAPIHESGLAERIAEHAGPDADHDGSDAEHAGPDADHDGSDAEHAGPDVDHDGPDTDHHGPDGSNASGNLRATTDYADVRETDVTFLLSLIHI
ncbi:nucleotide sugar dehydrogenase, partial [Natrialba magadii ATCC 43099]